MHQHEWDVTIAQAKSIQQRLSQKISLCDDFDSIALVAGTDVSIARNRKTASGAIVVLKFPELEIVDSAFACESVRFPYVPGYLSFREVPVLIKAFEQLHTIPDLFLCDGQGIAHPRRFGLACHFGLLTGIPSVGIGKSRLIGTYKMPGIAKGSASILLHQNQQIGHVLRSRHSVSPIFVSPGHRVSFDTALEFALQCCTRYRLPETTRHAHRLASHALTQVSECDAE